MPKLSSGINIYLSLNHILEPDLNWFKAPKGHFWYMTTDEECPPPYEPYADKTFSYQHSPVPKTREEMKRFVQICLERDDGMVYWIGDYLSDFPFFVKLDNQDLVDWKVWLVDNEERLNDFLDNGIEKCATQSLIMQDARGYVCMTEVKKPNGKKGWVKANKIVDNPLNKKQ